MGSNRKKTIIDMQALAQINAGKCLSNEYKNAITKLAWECKEGHEFNATPNSVQQGHWCPECAKKRSGSSQRLSIEEMHKMAEQRGGACLSTIYRNINTKLKWQCAEGHVWEATGASVRKGTWCGVCSSGVHEQICRAILENGFQCKFPKSYPDWLVNSLGNKMELDGYSKTLRLAFEYNGVQHYRLNKKFHKSEEELGRRQQDDLRKEALCLAHDVKLIVVPYTLKKSELRNFILNKLRELNFDLNEEKFIWSELDIYADSRNRLSEIRAAAENHGGKCLSKNYVDAHTKMSFVCGEGHEWEAIAGSIIKGHWCPECGRQDAAKKITKYDITFMHQIAADHGGECLSSEYLGVTQKLSWACANGHQWETTPAMIVKGHWCPMCSKSGKAGKYTIDHFQEIANRNGGRCLTSEYDGVHQKLKLQCAEGHEWEAPARSVLQGRWCRKCSKYQYKGHEVVVEGEKYATRADAARAYGISPKLVFGRMQRGQTIEQALGISTDKNNSK